MIYLDHNATTKCDPRVVETILPYFSEEFGNPASDHIMGENAREAVEKAREQVASLINANPRNIYFTNSATEANNIVLKGMWLKKKGSIDFITSPLEHSSVLKCIEALNKKYPKVYNINSSGCSISYIEALSNGMLKLDSLQYILKLSKKPFVSLMYANNEIGTINNVERIGDICKRHKVFYHCDAVQALGKVSIDVKKLNVDALVISSHKVYGPKGCAALYLKNDQELEPLIDGGYQNTFSSGTQNVPAIIGFGKACEILRQESKSENKRIEDLRNRLLEMLKKNISDLVVNGTMDNRIQNNLNISVPGVVTEAFIMGMDDIMVSGGSACTSGDLEPSYVLKTIKAPYLDCAIRFGLGRWTTKEEIEYTVKRIVKIAASIRK